ncbi:hypothetical protein PsorP6_018018 [Peronosclerospora sorghi]|uniref:Uncharacterized protein n=1 Tax=Peronosclerospora sorghi TaxID=230839 RepID=A0ACC0WE72_9STRA|nr:hypothetical protein PsorP6_018018 [Peronosclerospora sorghi]
MSRTLTIKTQKNAFKELLEIPRLAIRRQALTAGATLPVSGLLALSPPSMKQILDLPEKLLLPTKELEAPSAWQEAPTVTLNMHSLFGAS